MESEKKENVDLKREAVLKRMFQERGEKTREMSIGPFISLTERVSS